MKKDKELQDLLNEIMGKSVEEEEEELTPPVNPINKALLKKMTDKTKSRILKIFELEERSRETKLKAEAEQARLREQIRPLVAKWGIPLKSEQDLVLYLHPYKAQLQTRTEGGGINAEIILEWAKKNHPSLIIQQIDVGLLRNYLLNEDLPSEAKKAFFDALNKVSKLAQLVDGSSESRLDIGEYEEAKKAGKIPKKLLDQAEEPSKQYNVLLQTQKFTGKAKARCSKCGGQKPKNRTKVNKFVCPKCANSE